MKGIWNWLQMAIAAIGGFLGWLMGGWDGFLYALVVFVTIDYISGVLGAIVERKLSREIGFRGLFKKVFILCWSLSATS
jgi:toxin secretion/phage lysis holin